MFEFLNGSEIAQQLATLPAVDLPFLFPVRDVLLSLYMSQGILRMTNMIFNLNFVLKNGISPHSSVRRQLPLNSLTPAGKPQRSDSFSQSFIPTAEVRILFSILQIQIYVIRN